MISMREFPRPIVLVSKCLEFENVRYNGLIVRSRIVRDLMPLVDFITVCPECDIGMGVPRNPIRIVKKGQDYRLIQPATGEDITERMDVFTDEFLLSLGDVDGFIFKSGSPTIGIRNIKVYADKEMAPVVEKGAGFFTRKIVDKYPGYPMEEDDRLRNHRIRHHFLTQLYTFADLRHVRASGSVERLREFNKRNMFLLLSYDSAIYGKMCQLLENAQGGLETETECLFSSYGDLLKKALSRPGSAETKAQTVRMMISRFDKDVPAGEMDLIETLLQNYIRGRISEDAITQVMRLCSLRYSKDDVTSCTFLYPYPDVLGMPSDDRKDRDYWADQD